jgi:mannosyltransferase
MPITATLSKDSPLADRWKIGVAMAIVMVAAIALRLYNLGGPSLWYDEFLTVSIASGPLENIPQAVKIGEQTPPLFHFLMHGWFWLTDYNPSEFAIRLPAALCGIGAVWMMYLLANAIYGRREGSVAAMLMAVSTFQIAYSQEARVYSALMLMALVSSYFFVKLVQAGRFKNQIGYVLSTGLLFWIHLHSIFIVAAQQVAWFYLWISQRKRNAALKPPPQVWIICTFLALVLFAPMIPTVWFWLHKATGKDFWIGPMSAGFVPHVYAVYAGSVVMLVLLLVLASCGVCKTAERWKSVFQIALLLIPVLIPYVVSLIIRPLFVDRYAIAATAGLYILAARGCIALPNKVARAIAVLLLLGLSAFNVYPYLRDGPANKPDSRAATAYVMQTAHHGDVILLNSYANSIFVHYLRNDDTTKYRMTYETNDMPTAASVEPGTRMWVLSLRGPDGKYPTAFKTVAAERGWQLTETREFHGVELDRFSGK